MYVCVCVCLLCVLTLRVAAGLLERSCTKDAHYSLWGGALLLFFSIFLFPVSLITNSWLFKGRMSHALYRKATATFFFCVCVCVCCSIRDKDKRKLLANFICFWLKIPFCVCLCVFFSCSMIPLIFDQDRQQRAFVKKHGFFLWSLGWWRQRPRRWLKKGGRFWNNFLATDYLSFSFFFFCVCFCYCRFLFSVSQFCILCHFPSLFPIHFFPPPFIILLLVTFTSLVLRCITKAL